MAVDHLIIQEEMELLALEAAVLVEMHLEPIKMLAVEAVEVLQLKLLM